MPPKPDLVFNNVPNDVETDHPAFNVKLSPTKPDNDLSHTYRPSAPIIEDWVSDSEDESETKPPQNVSIATPKLASPKPTSNGKHENRKACFVCKSLDHLIKDCDYHEKKKAQPTARNHAQWGNHKQYAQMTLLNPQRYVVPTVVVPKSKLVTINAARPITAVVPKIKESSYNQNYNDNYYPYDLLSFPCCDNCGGSHETFQCQPMAQNIDFSGFDQFQTPQYPDVHPSSPEISNEVFQAKGDLMKSIETFLEKFNCIPFEEKPPILLQAWFNFFAIWYSKPKDPNELFQKLLEDLKELAEYKESLENSSKVIDASNSNPEREEPPQDSDIRQLIEECSIEIYEEQKQKMEDIMLELIEICRQKELYCMHDNVEDLIESALNSKLLSINSNSQLAPILSTKETEHPLSMGYENFNTTPETKSDEIIKSCVEELVPIPNECEVTSEDKRECNVLSSEDSSTCDVCDNHSDILSDSNDDDISSDDEAFEDIEYIEASLSNPEIVSVDEENSIEEENVVQHQQEEEESDNSLLDNFSPEFKTFCDHTKETRSGNTTTHADNSLPEYDSFCFEIEPNQERLINLVKNDISDDSSNDPLLEEADLFLASNNSIPPGIENFGDDAEGDVRFLEELLINDSILSHESSDSNFKDNPSVSRPPPKPPDADFELDFGNEISVVMNKFECLRDEFDDSFIFVKVFSFLSAESEDTIFDPVTFPYTPPCAPVPSHMKLANPMMPSWQSTLTRTKLMAEIKFDDEIAKIKGYAGKIGMETKMPNFRPCFPQHKCINDPKKGNPQHALKDKRVIDSGWSRHITGNMSYLSDFKELNGGYVAFEGNPKGGKISVKGKIKTRKLDFDDVYFVKELKFNLFSVSHMCDKKNSVLFTDTECLVLSPEFKLPDEIQVLRRVPRENNMYNVNLKNIILSGDLTCLFAKATLDESNLWHRRLGDINFKTINKLVKGNLVRGLPSKVFENNNTCVACKKGKQHRASCKTKPVSSINQPLYMLHMDLFGPTFVKSLNKKSYCLVVTDDYSRFTWVFFLATKDETSLILKTFIIGLENQLSLKVKVIRSDNGTEFKNNDLNQFCGMKGIKREFSVPRTPQQNSIAERKNGTLIEAARTMLADSLLLIPFWAKVDERFLVGYSVSSKTFRVFNTRTRIVQETLHVNFLENKPNVAGSSPTCSAQSKKHDDKTKKEAKGKSHVEFLTGYRNLSVEFEDFSNNIINKDNADDTSQLLDDPDMLELEDITYSHDEDDVGAEADFNNLETFITVSPILTTRVHKDHHVTQIIGDLSSATLTRKEPKRVHQALKDQSWIEAIQEELLQFKMQKVWVLVDLSYGKRPIDVKSAFLYGTIEEDVYVCQPLRFEDPDYPVKVYKVVKALYGLHQAPRAWYETLANYLLENGFQRGKIDQTLFIKRQKGDILLVQIYVDDIIFCSTNKDLCKAFEKLRKDKFKISSMGELTFFLGLQVKKKKDGIFISQDKYVAKILRKFGLRDGKSASAPIDTEKPLLKDPDGEDVDVYTYRSMIGSLMYLTLSRPDIMFAVCACACFQVTPKASHLHTVKRIFRYLKGKPHLGLWYPKDSPFDLVAYSDSDYVGASLDRKSTTGGCQFLRCRLISCPDQTVSGKDSSKPLMADNLPKIVWYSTHHVALMKSWLVQKQTALGKGFFGVETPLFEEMIVEQQVAEGADEVHDESVPAASIIAKGDVSAANDEVPTADKIAQALEITKLKQRVKKLKKRNKLKGIIANIDADEDVVLEVAKDVVVEKSADINESADIQGRTAESQAQIYQINLEHANKIITEVVTAASTTITVADVPILAATTAAAPTLTAAPSRRTKGVVIKDPEESATPSIIIHSEAKSKDKGKGILVKEPKPLKKQAQIEQDEQYARELEAELNKTIDWYEVIDHVQRKQKEDKFVKRYQALKRKPHNEAQARKNMMIYLKNVVGFKMDHFKGMSYDDIRLIFEKHFDSNVAFMQKTKEQMDEEDSRALKRLNESQEEKAAKKQKLDKEVEELKRHLQIVPNDEDDVYTEATPLTRKERFATTKPKNFSDDFLLITLRAMFEKPDIHAQIWKNQRSGHGQAKVKSWKLLESCVLTCEDQLFPTKHEKNYTIRDLELGAVVFALKIWRHYLYSTKCTMFIDHQSLHHILDQKILNMRQRRWMELLSNYDCELKYHPGKANVVADALSGKERLKHSRVQALGMILQMSLKARIQKDQEEALRQENLEAEKLYNADQKFKIWADGVRYLKGRAWIPKDGTTKKPPSPLLDFQGSTRHKLHKDPEEDSLIDSESELKASSRWTTSRLMSCEIKIQVVTWFKAFEEFAQGWARRLDDQSRNPGSNNQDKREDHEELRCNRPRAGASAEVICCPIPLSNGETLEVHGDRPKGTQKHLKSIKIDELKLETSSEVGHAIRLLDEERGRVANLESKSVGEMSKATEAFVKNEQANLNDVKEFADDPAKYLGDLKAILCIKGFHFACFKRFVAAGGRFLIVCDYRNPSKGVVGEHNLLLRLSSSFLKQFSYMVFIKMPPSRLTSLTECEPIVVVMMTGLAEARSRYGPPMLATGRYAQWKPKRVKDYTYHKEKMLLCKQVEKGVPLLAEQADWLADTDEEIDEQELEAHYNYMAKIQEVYTVDSGTDTEPLKQTELETYKTLIDRTIDYDKLEQKHLISLELALQQCQEQMKNDTVCKEKASNVFLKEREKYFEIQDLKAQLQDKNIAISELKKLIEKCKGKPVETKFDQPYVVRQPNAQKIPKPLVLGKPNPF
uniref:Uncharacterized mitochondrial protein AtMg00810-like n=1 Tax=Tanacetum cinerariifolium TaxID=118510 RepID=A0A6L2KR88_TANCI|nr:uncharacterized mitochondrial protein AtMg00810-like [Tanacetum cinerariifolium]